MGKNERYRLKPKIKRGYIRITEEEKTKKVNKKEMFNYDDYKDSFFVGGNNYINKNCHLIKVLINGKEAN